MSVGKIQRAAEKVRPPPVPPAALREAVRQMCLALGLIPGTERWDWYEGELTATLVDMGEFR